MAADDELGCMRGRSHLSSNAMFRLERIYNQSNFIRASQMSSGPVDSVVACIDVAVFDQGAYLYINSTIYAHCWLGMWLPFAPAINFPKQETTGNGSSSKLRVVGRGYPCERAHLSKASGAPRTVRSEYRLYSSISWNTRWDDARNSANLD